MRHRELTELKRPCCRNLLPVLAIAGVLLGACGQEASTSELQSLEVPEVVDAALSDVKTSANDLQDRLDEGTAVAMVLSDTAVMALDADALADIASGSLSVVFPVDRERSSALTESADGLLDSGSLVTEDGSEYRVARRLDGNALTVGAAKVTDLFEWNDLLVIVLDRSPTE